jgi:prepilin-type N-terminal cleavage/methylation domain-containing protein
VGARAFTLLELLIVVIIVGIVAALAVPSMSLASFERDAYNDAGGIMQLFRSARTRAIARGGAVMVAILPGASGRGQFLMFEATMVDPTGTTGNQYPVASCRYPTTWPIATMTPIDGIDLNGNLEQLATITAQPYVYKPAPATGMAAFSEGYVCYTPLGRSYLFIGPGGSAGPVFTTTVGAAGPNPNTNTWTPSLSPIEIQVTRTNGTTIRSVLVPPNGMARLFSHVQ